VEQEQLILDQVVEVLDGRVQLLLMVEQVEKELLY
tara:strand:+ start:433 stop:537 length:105 start_codon:yes stop_codon:yes gene_type:complete